MLLILSARTAGEDIAMHYGRLPPSFLPLGNQRLYALQAEIAAGQRIAMTVPEDYAIESIDREDIDRLGIELVPQTQRLTLTGAIADALDRLTPNEPLHILYGDTLVRMPETDAPDLVAVQDSSANYNWAYVGAEGGFFDAPPSQLETRRVVCGYYRFADPHLLRRACEAGGIVALLNAYDEARSLTLIEASEWFDFGHLPLYFQSKKSIMIKRMFNEIAYENHFLVKQSGDTAKIRAEANWYEHLPSDLKIHVPRYRGRVERDHLAGYAIEYLYHPLLSDLAAFGTLPLASWLEILSACFEFADKCQTVRPEPGAPEASPAFATSFFEQIIRLKTFERLGRYIESAGMRMTDELAVNGQTFPSLADTVQQLIEKIPPTTPEHIRFWHGDFFFGNTFYDFTARRVLTIDPRGLTADGQLCLYGDWRYDIAKLSHSVIGQYDKIILGRSQLTEEGPGRFRLTLSEEPHQEQIEAIFTAQITQRYGLHRDELIALTALLFFSMLPLHADRPDLQQRMLANALRLAGMIEGVAR